MNHFNSLIFLIGAARSGTTLLGEQLLSEHPEIYYLGESDYIWRYSIGYGQNHEILTKNDITKKIRKKIISKLNSAINNKRNKVILEKTPANCFRISFLNALFPEAKFIHLIRDGRDVALSSYKEWKGLKSKALDSKNLRSQKAIKRFYNTIKNEANFKNRYTRISDIYYAPLDLVKLINYLRRQLLKNDNLPWGPKFPGIKEIRKKFNLPTTCAIQWRESVIHAKSGLSRINSDRVLEIRYENLLCNPKEELQKIFQFMEVSCDSTIIDKLENKIVYKNIQKWKSEFSEEDINDIMEQISFTLYSLGYI